MAAQEKVLSLFEPHISLVRRGKAGKDTEFRHKVWFDEVDGGTVIRWQVLTCDPSDTKLWTAMIDHHQAQFGKPPHQASADRGVYSPENETYAIQQGVKRVTRLQVLGTP